jgi:hypothetical protein
MLSAERSVEWDYRAYGTVLATGVSTPTNGIRVTPIFCIDSSGFARFLLKCGIFNNAGWNTCSSYN